MTLGLIGCAADSARSGAALTESEEINAAITAGLVPEALQKDLDKQMTYADFCSVIDQFYAVMYPHSTEAWESVSAVFRTSKQLMTRSEGMMVFLYAAETVGLEAANYEYYTPVEDFFTQRNPGKDFWEGVAWDTPLLSNMQEQYYNDTFLNDERYAWRCDHAYMNNACWTAQCYSLGNGKPYFNWDENYSYRFGAPFTREEALCAIYRLYGTAQFAQFVPLSEISCLVTEQALEQAKTMPAAAYNDLPDFHGHTIEMRANTAHDGAGLGYTKSEVDALAAAGFNFVRVPLNFSHIFEGSDTSRASPAFFASMDQLLNWCAEAGIHVCFDLHDMPGFYTGGDDTAITLFSNEETQTLFADFWQAMTEHYQDVPSNLLSFNLLNEPHSAVDGEPTDETYSQVMRLAIHAIQEVSPDRLIFVDMLGATAGVPVEGLADEQVAQAFHPYLITGNMNWPTLAINGFFHRDQGKLTLQGDFATGMQISISIEMAHSVSTLELVADGTVLSTFSVGSERLGEGGCIQIGEQGTGGEWRSYEDKVWSYTLTQPCSRLQIRQTGNGAWYMPSNISLTSDTMRVDIAKNENLVPNQKPPQLTVAADGTVTAADPKTLFTLDANGLRDTFGQYEKFRQRTGQEIMAQEFGCPAAVDSEIACRANDDLLLVLTEMDIPWCSWSGDFGALLLANVQQKCEQDGETALHERATYTDNGEGWLIYEEMLEVYQKYM